MRNNINELFFFVKHIPLRRRNPPCAAPSSNKKSVKLETIKKGKENQIVALNLNANGDVLETVAGEEMLGTVLLDRSAT